MYLLIRTLFSVVNFIIHRIVFNDIKIISVFVITLLYFRIGDYVTLGGRVAIRDHVSIISKVNFLNLVRSRFNTIHSTKSDHIITYIIAFQVFNEYKWDFFLKPNIEIKQPIIHLLIVSMVYGHC